MNYLIQYISSFLWRLLSLFMNIVEFPFNLAEKYLGQRRIAWFFLAPTLVLFSIFTFLPIILSIAYSFTGGTEILLTNRPFVGLDNYAALLDCENYLNPNTCQYDGFMQGILNTGSYAVFNVVFTILIALFTAIILNRKMKGRGFFRALFFYPVLLSPVVVGLIWKWFLERMGLLNLVIEHFGGQEIIFLLDIFWSRFWVVFVSVWFHMGFYMLILLAGLQAIPPDVYEAAQIDGTSKPRVFFKITLPLLMPNILVVFILVMIRSVQVFDEAWVLTDGGGPGTTNNFIVQFIYETAFANDLKLYGLASAASVLMGVVLLLLTIIQLWITKMRNKGEEI